MSRLNIVIGYIIALIVAVWRRTCRYSVIDDARPALRRAGRPYVYALLHAHQAAAVFVNDEADMAAMVSRSADGDLLVPSLRLRGVRPVRGSTRKANQDKGGRQALTALGALLEQRVPALLAVDGPRGPRNHVHRGVVQLAVDHGAAILPVVVVPSRRWILRKTWDRMQIPKPFCHIRLVCGAPIDPGAAPAATLRDQVRAALFDLEARWDGEEHAIAGAPRPDRC